MATTPPTFAVALSLTAHHRSSKDRAHEPLERVLRRLPAPTRYTV